MRVKRYVVDSMPDALQQIRTDLGKDAVILNTKEIRSGGFLGLFSKKKIEVIAATDTASATANASRPRQPTTPARPAPQPSAGLMPEMSAAQTAVAVLEQRIAAQEPQPAVSAPRQEARNLEPEGPMVPMVPVVPLQHGAAAYGATAGQPVAVKPKLQQAVPVQESKIASVPEDTVLAELRAMKQMMQKLASAGVLAEEPNPVIEELKERLTEQELRSEIVQELLGDLEEMARDSGEELDGEFAKRVLKDKLRIMLGANTHKSLSPETRIAHFVGPTGVGKTTTIAKLAAEQVLKYRRKVGFITSDTYRIAAVDQLKTYATILGVPLEVVFSPMDLKKAFDALHDRDIIFMDTAGRNFRNEMYVSELNALLHAGGRSETYLVMSLTTKYKDMRAIADNFSKFKLDKVLFTKRDETDTFGPIVNLLHEFPLQLSYITTGQNVPDDFAVADENEIIDLILEEQSDE
ncbi:flagellar biosynthesis protein FlhF [Gorillibacterium sp. sgz5001074]|uniref:flagellar biosynthesis protein FlhF n=1 Tax=Gorillibacterium sp. sgz5001074 TaxID=3446695 RepID=UPI003F670CBE